MLLPLHRKAQQLLVFLDCIISSSVQVDAIYLVLQKTFDIVSHEILLKQLWLPGITGTQWMWFKCYLTGCLQSVSINNKMLDGILPVISGVL